MLPTLIRLTFWLIPLILTLLLAGVFRIVRAHHDLGAFGDHVRRLFKSSLGGRRAYNMPWVPSELHRCIEPARPLR